MSALPISIEVAAAKYADHGLFVFPVDAPEKRPLTQHGHLDASDDVEVVVAMFRDAVSMHGACVGIGVDAGRSGLVIIDPDTPEAELALSDRVGEGVLRDGGLRAKTGRGRHYYYAAPDGVNLRPIVALCGIAGLDVRAGSSWAILPPSSHATGATYEWESRDLAGVLARFSELVKPCPQGIITMLQEHGADYSNPADSLRDDDGRTRIPEGQRNATLWRIGREARRWGADETAVTALINATNADQCVGKLDAREIKQIIDSVMTNAPDPGAIIPADAIGEGPATLKLRRLDVALMVTTDPPPVPWIVEGLVARGMVTMIHGAPGLGKSMLALALASAVVRGVPFMNNPTSKGRVLYIDAENGEGEAHRRIRGLGITVDSAANLDYREAVGVDLIPDEIELRNAAADSQPLMIIVDSLATLNRSDENESRDMTSTLQVLWRLAHETDAGVVVLHHDRKDKTAMRGSSAIEAVVQIIWHLTRDEQRGDTLLLRNMKCRPAALSKERWVDIRATATGLEVAQVMKPPTGEEAELWELVEDLLGDGKPRTNRDIAEALGKLNPSGSCPGNLSGLLKAKREAGYLVGHGAGGVTLPQIGTDPLISPPRAGSQDQHGDAA
jgi:KaiC/GvpD/RAD55 family RecA-like ATPase